MKIFEKMPVDTPTVEVTPLDRDETGRDLLERLASLESQKAEAEKRATSASRPLPSLIARADELAAQSLAGRATVDEAEEAEDEVRKVQADIEAARREARQCAHAIGLVRQQLNERSEELYRENTENVRAAHRSLLKEALQAQHRAATLLRILREFEMRYARYTDSDQPEPYPRYLRDADRTQPPRSIMGPAKSPNGHIYASSDATEWMQRAAALVDADGPAVVDVQELDFESHEATFTLDDAHRLPPEGTVGAPQKPSPPATSKEKEMASVASSTESANQDSATRPLPHDRSGAKSDMQTKPRRESNPDASPDSESPSDGVNTDDDPEANPSAPS